MTAKRTQTAPGFHHAVVSCAIATVIGCAPKLAATNPDVAWTTADAAEGRQLFLAVCAACHGERGDGNSMAANVLFPRPRDLTAGEYRFRSTASGLIPLRSDILRTIARGLPGTAMPSWQEQLTWRQMMSIVLYLEELSPRFHDEDYAPEEDDILVRWDQIEAPPRSPELIARGREVYTQMKCADCHGDQGQGNGPSAATLEDADGRRSDVFDFSYGIYKGGHAPADVYRTFMTGLDGTPMPSFADALPEKQDRWALVYYCLSLTKKRGAWFYLTERPTWEEH